MSFYDDQLKNRQKSDQKILCETLEEMARTLIDSPNKINLRESIERNLKEKQVVQRPVKLEEGWYKEAAAPMLGTLKKSGETVILIPKGMSGYCMIDLSTGEKIRITKKTESLLSENAVMLYNPFPYKTLTIGSLIRYMIGQLKVSDIIRFLGMLLITTLLGMLTPVFTKWLFGDVLDSKSMQVLFSLAGFMLSFSICKALIGIYNSLMKARINVKINVAVQAAVMHRILHLPPRFFKKYSSGELAEKSAHVENLCNTIFETIGTSGITAVFSLVYIFQIFAYAPVLVIPSLLITMATIAISVITTLKQIKINRKSMEISAKTTGMSYSMITGIRKIKLAGAENRVYARWGKQYAQQIRYQYNPPIFLKLSSSINLAISLFGTIVLYFLAIASGVRVADYYAFNSAYGMVSGAIASFAGIATTIATIKPTLEMARPIMECSPEIGEGKKQITDVSGNIELNNVYFRYEENMPYVINGLSLKINKGEYVAIVGTTGCGKSTLLRLLLGFEMPEKGAIYYDGNNIENLELESLRRKIGTVMQDGKLFLADIYSNIVISAPELTLSEAWEAAEIASVADDIREMPMGMHTLISEGLGGISGGQKQRLMIARAIAPKPNILMFDEATSALDNITQKKVSEAIDKLNCTRIVIAHRLSTIQSCDRIIVMDKGNIAESGTYEELIAKNGLFSELVARQHIDKV